LVAPRSNGQILFHNPTRKRCLAGNCQRPDSFCGQARRRCRRRNFTQAPASKKAELEKALAGLSQNDSWKLTSRSIGKSSQRLVEYSLVQVLKEAGYKVRRMPEDMAKHIGGYAYFDFEVRSQASSKARSQITWGTNTKFARLIHSLTDGYPTSSCKFATQDFLRSVFSCERQYPRICVRPFCSQDVMRYGFAAS